MNKKRLKLKYRKDTVRVVYEPDYNHEAWESDVRPTHETVPDAFFERTEPAHPKSLAPEIRLKPHRTLTTTMLRRRLYGAGVRGAEAKRVLTEIMAGEKTADGLTIPMAWSVSGFRKQFGKRIARAVLRFVHVAFIIIDESWNLLQAASSTFIEKAFMTARKFSSAPIVVEQVMPTAPVALARRISFHH